MLSVFKRAVCVFCLPFVTVQLAIAAQEIDPALEVIDTPQVTVTVEDINRYILENLPADAGQRQAVLNRPGVFREMAENLYLIRAIAAQAEESPGFDEAQLRWAADMAYQRKLMESYRVAYVRETLKDVNWESVAREHYKANPERYARPERISAAHILIRTDERSEEEAAALAKELHARIVAGEDFSAIAREYSEDGSAGNGGELGFFQRGKMVPQFEEVAFALDEPGDMSSPVKTEFGYHIIMLRDRTPSGEFPFDEVKNQIIDTLQRKMGNQVWQDKILAMRSSQELQLDEALLKEIRDKYVVRIDSAK
tara:strand:+ start:50740 stop:51672 length:933 start_codon:yes stop_codon:yes gene_type:complete